MKNKATNFAYIEVRWKLSILYCFIESHWEMQAHRAVRPITETRCFQSWPTLLTNAGMSVVSCVEKHRSMSSIF